MTVGDDRGGVGVGPVGGGAGGGSEERGEATLWC